MALQPAHHQRLSLQKRGARRTHLTAYPPRRLALHGLRHVGRVLPGVGAAVLHRRVVPDHRGLALYHAETAESRRSPSVGQRGLRIRPHRPQLAPASPQSPRGPPIARVRCHVHALNVHPSVPGYPLAHARRREESCWMSGEVELS